MTTSASVSALDPLFVEGLDWVARMASEDFSEADRAGFVRWRGTSARHAEAFAQAAALGSMVREVARETPVVDGAPSGNVVPLRARRVDRRALLAGALAASAAGVMIIRAPVASRTPDYSTGTGERRRVAIAPGLDIEMDAKTAIAVDRVGDRHVVALLAGRAAVDARLGAGQSVALVAGKGRSLTRNARFDVDADAAPICLTCISGGVLFDLGGQRVPVAARQQLSYTDTRITPPRRADIAAAIAWTNGQLIFHRKRFEEVIHAINRYRPGKVMLVNAALSDRPINAVFHVAQIEGAVDQLQQISGARVTRLPGGVVIFS